MEGSFNKLERSKKSNKSLSGYGKKANRKQFSDRQKSFTIEMPKGKGALS